ncbi:hypothetical protein GCM10009839_78550 [Catenulispora yoronensis]|uniref:Uncharacterized protein n=1 Tax=Catenulispora yoronensis TaxID=450799 RepID=A0ABN2VB11_9ACTN
MTLRQDWEADQLLRPASLPPPEQSATYTTPGTAISHTRDRRPWIRPPAAPDPFPAYRPTGRPTDPRADTGAQ